MGWPKGKPRSDDEKRRISSKLKGVPHGPMSIEVKKKISLSTKGRKAWNEGLPMWWTTSRMTGKEPWNKGLRGEYTTTKRGKKQPRVSGKNHWNWQGGITSKNHAIRVSLESKLWRRAVFERDNYTCVWCGARSGKGKSVTLHADHIQQFAFFPKLRFELSNGRSLCKDCHKKTDTFSRRKPC